MYLLKVRKWYMELIVKGLFVIYFGYKGINECGVINCERECRKCILNWLVDKCLLVCL